MASSSESKIVLYNHPASSNACRPVIYLNERGIEFESRVVDLFKGEHKKPEYLAINPRHQIPTLVDGDAVVYESVAILLYLEARFPGPTSLLPSIEKDPKAYATAITRIGEFTNKLDQKVVGGSVLFGKINSKADAPDRVEAFLAEAAVWEKYLSDGHAFLAGSMLTIADIAVFPAFLQAFEALGLPAENHPHLRKWLDNLLARESFDKAAQAQRSFWAHVHPEPIPRILAE